MSNPTGGSVTGATSLFRPSILTVTSDFSHPANGLSTGAGDATGHQTTALPIIEPATPIHGVDPQPVPNVEKSVPSDYVFGCNISSRVVNADTTHGASSNLLTVTSDQSSSSVFTELAKAVSSKPIESNSKTLADSVNKITEDQKHSALNLSEIDPVTGEEDELPIFRQHCRAYIFDTEKQKWNSLGGSHFHLNDSRPEGLPDQSGFRSRIVVRLASTRRVIINSPVWADMPVALVNSRNLRIGAISEDGGHIRSYLLTFSSDELACTLFDLLSVRKEKVEPLKKVESPSNTVGHKRSADVPAGGPSPKLATLDSTASDFRCSQPDSNDHATAHFPQSVFTPNANQTDVPAGGTPAKVSDDSVKPPCKSILVNTVSTVVEQFRKFRSQNFLDFSRSPQVIDSEDGYITLELNCQLYSFDEEKRDWLQRGAVDICVKDVSSESTALSNCAEDNPQNTAIPAHSCLTINTAGTHNLLTATPIWSGTTACLVDERVVQLVTATPGYKGDDSSPVTPEVSAYLVVMQSPEDATKFYQTIVSRIDSVKEHCSRQSRGASCDLSSEVHAAPEMSQPHASTDPSETTSPDRSV
ncbi:Ran-binding protein 3 [Clonorchis sinensis]|uniref:Ran-binding protein 3 n=2 Tax=Clonorchis sinensis TaxID=79923 RepID=H2KUV6_CLOSI|nr:Ran-binding protein 3 [Clonorchis sinensis]GAA28681.2 Ran-binding protein 3 [Clonorchis sinensis]